MQKRISPFLVGSILRDKKMKKKYKFQNCEEMPSYMTDSDYFSGSDEEDVGGRGGMVG